MAASAQVPTQAQTEISAIVNALIDSWNSHDMSAYAEQFADDADFVNVLGMHWHGRTLIEERHVEIHKTIFRNSRLRLLNSTLRPLAPGVVLGHIEWEMTGHDQIPGVPFVPVRKGVITAVFVDKDGRWAIAALQNADCVAVSLPPHQK